MPTATSVAATTVAKQAIFARKSRDAATVQNLGPDTVYLIAASGLPASAGIQVKAGQSLPLASEAAKAAYWVITASGTADVRVLEDLDIRLVLV